MPPSIITLLTDFGTSDGYVGEVKGVIVSAAPGVTVVDIRMMFARRTWRGRG